MRYCFYVVISLLLLVGCKSAAEKERTSVLLNTQVEAIKAAILSSVPLNVERQEVFDALCADWHSLPSSSPLDTCASVGRTLGEIDAYLHVDTEQRIGETLATQVSEVQQGLDAEKTIVALTWLGSVSNAINTLDAQIATSMAIDDFVAADERSALALLDDTSREGMTVAIDTYLGLLATISPGGPSEAMEAQEALETLREQVTRVSTASSTIRQAVIDEVDNDEWANAILPARTPPTMQGLRALMAQDLPQSALAIFRNQVRAIDEPRRQLSGKLGETSSELNEAASKQFLSDCFALLQIDEAAFDETCGGLAAFALDGVLTDLARSGTGYRDAAASGPPPKNDLKTRLRAYSEATYEPDGIDLVRPQGVSAAERDRLRRVLENRIRVASRAYAEAAYAGSMSRYVEIGAVLESFHDALGLKDAGPRLRDPLALLQPDAVHQAHAEWSRLERILRLGASTFDGDVALAVARDSAGAMVERLEKIVFEPLETHHLAQIAERSDPEKLEAVLIQADELAKKAIAQKTAIAGIEFQALPVEFENWRGPRGPPVNPAFPRSADIIQGLEQIIRDPSAFAERVGFLRAEHATFYDQLERHDGTATDVVERWKFGRANPYGWMLAQMSGADLATLRTRVTAMRPATGMAESVPVLDRTYAELETIRAEIDAEIERRSPKLPDLLADGRMKEKTQPVAIDGVTQSGGRHPPGYPPGRPPEIRVALEKWLVPGNATRNGFAVREMSARTILGLYTDPDTMPAAMVDSLRETMKEAVDGELARLDALADRVDDLNRRTALSVDVADQRALATFQEAKTLLVSATDAMAERLALLERAAIMPTDADRWHRLRRISLRYGGKPPPAAPGAMSVSPKVPGSGGNGGGMVVGEMSDQVAVRELALDARLARSGMAIERAEILLADRTAPLRMVTTRAGTVGAERGRAVARAAIDPTKRLSTDALFDTKNRTRTRYPEDQHDWRGFLQEQRGADGKITEVPYNHERDVINGENFRALGGGIHFGTVAEPSDSAIAALADRIRLDYDEASQMLRLMTLDGMVHTYGPVAPRDLKALYHYVTSYPGINLAITIGTLGETVAIREDDQSPVMLDPSFIDNPVGQTLYFADTIPWSLGDSVLPEGASSPIAEAFAAAMEKSDTGTQAKIARLTAMIETAPAWRDLDRKTISEMLPTHLEADERDSLLLIATADGPDAFARMYRELLRQRSVSPKYYAAIEKVALELQTEGYSAGDVEAAIQIAIERTINYFPSDTLLESFGQDPGFGNSKAAKLARRISLYDVTLFKNAAAVLSGKSKDETLRIILPDSELKERVATDLARFGNLATSKDAAARFYAYLRPAASQDDRYFLPPDLVRLGGSAIKEIYRKVNEPVSSEQIAIQLIDRFNARRGLAVLFDEASTFDTVRGNLVITPKMRYRYVYVDYDVDDKGFTIWRDTTVGHKPISTMDSDPLNDLVNGSFGTLVERVPSLGAVNRYAGIAALLRWAVCPQIEGDTCIARDDVTVDFAALGAYPLRDRDATPTPDATIK